MVLPICEQLLSSGQCRDATCRANHNVSTCDLCRLMFPSTDAYTLHLSQQEHKDALQEQGRNWFFCYLCDSHHSGRVAFDTHIKSLLHIRRAKEAGIAPNIPAQQSEVVPGHRLCTFCNLQIPWQTWSHHVGTAKHKSKEQFASFSVVLEQAERDKHGVTVTGDLDFKVVKIASASEGVKISARIETSVPSADIKLVKTQLASLRGMKGKMRPTPCVVFLNLS